MLRLKRIRESPPGGFRFIHKPSGWQAHGWSFNAVAAQWFNEQLKRGVKTTIEHARHEVEQFVCQELVLHHPQWTEWVDCEAESDSLPPMDNFDRDASSPRYDGRFTVVYPFCAKDGALALKNMKWIAEITEKCHHSVVLSHDASTGTDTVSDMEREASKVFTSLKTFRYESPRIGQWPPTHAFRSAANFMMKVGTPWLWMEYDCIPLKPDWLDQLQEAYWKSGKAFAGPIVPDLGHCNGTAIYPANTPRRIPRALNMIRTAWDVTMKPEMINDCHNLHPLIYHAWSMNGGKLHPYAGGSPPEFPLGSPLLEQIPKESVLFHRDKAVSLPDRLRERKLVTV